MVFTVVATCKSTRIIDFSERDQNLSYTSRELRDMIRRKIARFKAEKYREWALRNPKEVAILDQ